MAYKINEECTMCGVCVSECPTNAISETKDVYVIDQAECTDCALCVDACPAGAIIEA